MFNAFIFPPFITKKFTCCAECTEPGYHINYQKSLELPSYIFYTGFSGLKRSRTIFLLKISLPAEHLLILVCQIDRLSPGTDFIYNNWNYHTGIVIYAKAH